MAQTIMCDNHETEQALFLLTNLASGDTISLCLTCWIEFVEVTAGALQRPPEAAESATEPAADSVAAEGSEAPATAVEAPWPDDAPGGAVSEAATFQEEDTERQESEDEAAAGE
mgnify:CR=1 FL=1